MCADLGQDITRIARGDDDEIDDNSLADSVDANEWDRFPLPPYLEFASAPTLPVKRKRKLQKSIFPLLAVNEVERLSVAKC